LNLHFFLIFLRFSTKFTRISKVTLLFEMRFCRRPLERFGAHTYTLGSQKKTLERSCSLQCGPPGRWPARPRRNPAGSPTLAAGKGRGRSPHSLRGRFRGSAGSGRGPARGRTGGRQRWSQGARLRRALGRG
jgi:hypothetical protein